MAEEQSNRTEQATAKHKAEARKKGQVAVSREVPTAAVLLGGIAMLASVAGDEAIAEEERRGMARQMADMASQLGSAMSDR